MTADSQAEREAAWDQYASSAKAEAEYVGRAPFYGGWRAGRAEVEGALPPIQRDIDYALGGLRGISVMENRPFEVQQTIDTRIVALERALHKLVAARALLSEGDA